MLGRSGGRRALVASARVVVARASGSRVGIGADEASLLVENGPNVLAECLVKLGGRLAQPRSFG